jgi:hypothetical protein
MSPRIESSTSDGCWATVHGLVAAGRFDLLAAAL